MRIAFGDFAFDSDPFQSWRIAREVTLSKLLAFRGSSAEYAPVIAVTGTRS
jgi:hypothetical protein